MSKQSGNGFKIMDLPPCPTKKHGNLIAALLDLPEGKAICVPLERFHTNPALSLRNGLRPRTERKLRTRRVPDGWCIWLEPERKEKAQ